MSEASIPHLKISTFNYMEKVVKQLNILVAKLEQDADDDEAAGEQYSALMNGRRADRIKDIVEKMNTTLRNGSPL